MSVDPAQISKPLSLVVAPKGNLSIFESQQKTADPEADFLALMKAMADGGAPQIDRRRFQELEREVESSTSRSNPDGGSLEFRSDAEISSANERSGDLGLSVLFERLKWQGAHVSSDVAASGSGADRGADPEKRDENLDEPVRAPGAESIQWPSIEQAVVAAQTPLVPAHTDRALAPAAAKATVAPVEPDLGAAMEPDRVDVADPLEVDLLRAADEDPRPRSSRQAPVERMRAAEGERSPAPIISHAPEARPVLETRSESGRPEKLLPSGRSEAVPHLTIVSLETHFPAIVANTLAPQAPAVGLGEQRIVRVEIAPSSAVAETRQKVESPMRVLTIALEPASLGAVVVKMRMSGPNIELEIKVDSVEALQTLTNTRDHLVDAIKATGCEIESCTIQIGSASGSTDSSQSSATGQRTLSNGAETESRANGGDDGARHGARNDEPRENQQGHKEGGSRDVAPPYAADRAHGVYL